jgi:hypothetical protein
MYDDNELLGSIYKATTIKDEKDILKTNIFIQLIE